MMNLPLYQQKMTVRETPGIIECHTVSAERVLVSFFSVRQNVLSCSNDVDILTLQYYFNKNSWNAKYNTQ